MTLQGHACPKCGRKLKPVMVKDKITLGCRYCNYEINESTKTKKDKNTPRSKPDKCPDCEGTNVSFSEMIDEDAWWKCDDCHLEFQWITHKAVFAIEVEYECMPEEAKEIAWLMLSSYQGREVELMGYWVDGKYDAHLKFSKEERKKRIDRIK